MDPRIAGELGPSADVLPAALPHLDGSDSERRGPSIRHAAANAVSTCFIDINSLSKHHLQPKMTLGRVTVPPIWGIAGAFEVLFWSKFFNDNA